MPRAPASWVAHSPSRNTGKVRAGLARSLGVTKSPYPGATGDAQATFNLPRSYMFFCVCVCVWVRVGVRVCVHLCTVFVLCVHAMYTYVHYHAQFFTTLDIHDTLLLLMSRASLGAAA